MSNIIAIKYNGINVYSYVNIINILRFLTEDEFEEFAKILNKYDNKGIYLNNYQDIFDFSNVKEYIKDTNDIKIITKYFNINL